MEDDGQWSIDDVCQRTTGCSHSSGYLNVVVVELKHRLNAFSSFFIAQTTDILVEYMCLDNSIDSIRSISSLFYFFLFSSIATRSIIRMKEKRVGFPRFEFVDSSKR